ncbi:clathrin light chain [Tothia fuscella]|uniref:Clathrin light chain n=1 Tax=Tothia fuscella TaxID=1048955 RepID=A0A9P4NSZ9_9PEZI|nr:clathrin light chain [Tothia fuscella]
MANRFPSLEEFDAGQISASADDISGNGGSFLVRERAALGDDADLFSTPADNMASVEDAGEDDLLGGGRNNNFSGNGNGNGNSPDEGFQDFEDAFPSIDTTNDHMAPGGTITGSSLLPGAPNSYSAPSYRASEDEPEVLKVWREKRDADIATRDKVSAERKAATVAQAQRDLDDFYDNYNDKKEKAIAQTRRQAEEFLSARDDTTAGGTSWERIGKLVDLSGKGAKGGSSGSGKERMRELLISLRKDENAPGASGV